MPTQTHTRALALRLFDELGREILGASLVKRGWTFGFDRARRRSGACRPATKRITLSAHLSRTLPEAEVEDTVRHEACPERSRRVTPSITSCTRTAEAGAPTTGRGRRLPAVAGPNPSGASTATSPTIRPHPTPPSALCATPRATSTASPSAPTSARRAQARADRPTSASRTAQPAASSGRAGRSAASTAAPLASQQRAPGAARPSAALAVPSARRPVPRAAAATLADATTTASASVSRCPVRDDDGLTKTSVVTAAP